MELHIATPKKFMAGNFVPKKCLASKFPPKYTRLKYLLRYYLKVLLKVLLKSNTDLFSQTDLKYVTDLLTQKISEVLNFQFRKIHVRPLPS